MVEEILKWILDKLHGLDAFFFAASVVISLGIWLSLGTPKNQRKRFNRRGALALLPMIITYRRRFVY